MIKRKRTLVRIKTEDEEYLNEYFESPVEKNKFKTRVIEESVNALRSQTKEVTVTITISRKVK